MVIPGCVHSHEMLEKTHVKQSSITLDDYDAQSLEVARQVETGLFMIRIDHLIRDEYACNPLLNDLAIDLDDETGINSVARDSENRIFPIVSHMRWSMLAVVNSQGVCFRLIRLS